MKNFTGLLGSSFIKPAAAFIALTATAALMPSCKDYLDIKPLATVTQENFWTTKEDAIRGVNGTYSIMRRTGFNEGLFPVTDIMSDDVRKGSNPGDALGNVGDPYERFQVTPVTGEHFAWYSTLYQGVKRANAVIAYVPRINMDAALKRRVLGEARFLRALFYLDLIRGFGKVPYVVDVQPPPVEAVEQLNDREIYTRIIKPDLDSAIAYLPQKGGTGDYAGDDVGRATKGAAQALLARAALYIGGMWSHERMFDDENPQPDLAFAQAQFVVARDAAVEVVNSGVYALEPDYVMAFRVEGNYGPESVFEIGAVGNEDFFSQDLGGNQYGNVQGVRGSPNKGWGFKRPSMPLLRAFLPGDQRKEKTIIRVGEVLDGIEIRGEGNTDDVTINDPAKTTYDPRLATGDTAEIEVYSEKVWTPGTNPPSAHAHHRRMIRYADVLLMAAEGIVETGGDLAQAANYINQVRARARAGNAGAVPDIAPTDADSVRRAVYTERRFELALEDTRFFDLVRTGRTDLMVPLGFKKGKHEHLPIPQSEIDITAGRIKQNKGYN